MHAIFEFESVLSRSVMSGAGLGGIAGVLHDAVERPITLWSTSGQILATTDGLEPQSGFDGDQVTSIDGLGAARLGPWLCCVIGRGAEGIVVGALDGDGSAGRFAELAVEQAAQIAALELFRMRSIARTELKVWGDLTTAIFDGEDPARVASLATSLGYDLGQERRVLVMEPEASPVARDRVHVDARALDQHALTTTRDDHPVLIVKNHIDWSALRRAVDTTEDPLRVGASSPTSSARGLALGLREAHVALRMSVATDGPRLTHFEDLGLFQLLANADPAELEVHVERWIGPVVEHDRVRNAELLRTLTEYLERGCSVEQTARALFIHRSTLRYRLGRIETLLDRDLREADTRFNLQLATRALATMRAINDSGDVGDGTTG